MLLELKAFINPQDIFNSASIGVSRIDDEPQTSDIWDKFVINTSLPILNGNRFKLDMSINIFLKAFLANKKQISKWLGIDFNAAIKCGKFIFCGGTYHITISMFHKEATVIAMLNMQNQFRNKPMDQFFSLEKGKNYLIEHGWIGVNYIVTESNKGYVAICGGYGKQNHLITSIIMEFLSIFQMQIKYTPDMTKKEYDVLKHSALLVSLTKFFGFELKFNEITDDKEYNIRALLLIHDIISSGLKIINFIPILSIISSFIMNNTIFYIEYKNKWDDLTKNHILFFVFGFTIFGFKILFSISIDKNGTWQFNTINISFCSNKLIHKNMQDMKHQTVNLS